jgi:hypothetical protein
MSNDINCPKIGHMSLTWLLAKSWKDPPSTSSIVGFKTGLTTLEMDTCPHELPALLDFNKAGTRFRKDYDPR